ncbi:MAG: type II toxin-antitoxin system VapC family toxin [Chloroflexota bacterium]|nr:type II toxin-antitoxin system VapC family toxin [Chloroflexota bacterium]
MPFVLDASVTLAWLIEGEATSYSSAVLDRLRDEGAVVPAVWPLEVANALLMGERRGRVSMAEVTRATELLTDLPITLHPVDVSLAWGPTLALARQQAITVYDAIYLELAVREGLPLATQDARLRAAAERAGVEVLADPAAGEGD